MRDEFSDPGLTSDVEESAEAGLRPRALDDFVGQRELKEHLSIVLEAARQRAQSVDHLLFDLGYVGACLACGGRHMRRDLVSCGPKDLRDAAHERDGGAAAGDGIDDEVVAHVSWAWEVWGKTRRQAGIGARCR